MGSLTVVLRGKSCFVELIDDNKKVFASTMIRDDGPSVVLGCSDDGSGD